MQQSQSKLERSIAGGIICFGVLVVCSSNELAVTAFGVVLLMIGGVLLRWG